MSEENKKIEKIESEIKPVELSEQDLEQVAGGGTTPAPPKPDPLAQHKATQSWTNKDSY